MLSQPAVEDSAWKNAASLGRLVKRMLASRPLTSATAEMMKSTHHL